MNISIGGVNLDSGVAEINGAFIYKQSPEPATTKVDGTSVKNYLGQGDKITVWLNMQMPSGGATGSNVPAVKTDSATKPATHQ
jgi:hypothetical protein